MSATPASRIGPGWRAAALAFVQRRAGLVGAILLLAWVAWVAGALVAGQRFRPSWLVTLGLVFLIVKLLGQWALAARRRTIRESMLPRFVKRNLRTQYPALDASAADLVERGFRQFFLACSRSDGAYVAMPSKIVDAYWHAFILDTRSYAAWCERTLGRFLHHTPTERLGNDAKHNDGLRRAWSYACKEESINPRTPTRLPLLFALDHKLGIEGGVAYSPRPRPAGGASGDGGTDISYAGDFGDGSFSGDAGGLGGSDSGGGDGGDGGGDGGGGGCGGD